MKTSMNKEWMEHLQALEQTALKGLKKMVCINCNSAMWLHSNKEKYWTKDKMSRRTEQQP